MKKKLLSLACALALTISLLPAAQALEGEGTRAAEALASLGLVTGTGAGYAAEDAATQEQAAALLVRLLGAEKTAKADRRSCGWAGIPSWARSAVNYCAFHDLIDWSEYRAGGALDAELWCAMLLRALGCGSELGSSAARTALRIGLISRPLEGTLTRGDLFETALAALTYPAKDGGTLLDGLLAKGLCTAAAVDALGLRRKTLTAREAADRHLSAILCLDLFADEEAIEADEPTANASAFLISPDGLAVTNYHSIDGAISGRATLITGEACAIERVIYYDADIDLAVIRIARTTAEGETVPRFHAIALAGAGEAITTMARLARTGVMSAMGVLEQYDAHTIEVINENEEHIDKLADHVDNYLIRLSPHMPSGHGSDMLNYYIQCFGEFERIGDHAVNLTENAQEFLDRSASLSPTAHQELMVLREVLGEILDYTYKAFAATDYEAARHIEPVEEVVDDLVATLRANHIRRVRDGQCTVYAGLTFLDILVNVERIADQCSNVGVFTLSMFDEHIMNNHHDYIQALHQGKDPVFNRAYQEAHDKYFGELKRIERSK